MSKGKPAAVAPVHRTFGTILVFNLS